MKKTALSIVKQLHRAGYEAYYAGGSVRDMLMGKEPPDIDIVTSARPDDIERVLHKTIPVGKRFGVIVAIEDGHRFEVATFRSDSDLSDGRRPDAVYFSEPREDALRRDFTINGMFYDPIRDEIIDHVGGQDDLKRKVIRFIGDPDQRIQEDYLRIMRAVRFKVKLGFTYANTTFQAIRQSAAFVAKNSGERIREEFSKLLAPEDVAYTFNLVFEELDHAGLLQHLLPEIEALKYVPQPPAYHAEGDVYIHTMRCLKSLHPSTPEPVIWAVLLHDVGKQTTIRHVGDDISFRGHEEEGVRIGGAVLDRLKFSKADRDRILWLIRHHMTLLDFEKMRDAKRRRWFMHPWFPDLLKVFRADAVGTKPTELSDVNRVRQLYDTEKNLKLLEPPTWLVNGDDLIESFGLPRDRRLGELLEQLHDAQLEGKLLDKPQALAFAADLIKHHT